MAGIQRDDQVVTVKHVRLELAANVTLAVSVITQRGSRPRIGFRARAIGAQPCAGDLDTARQPRLAQASPHDLLCHRRPAGIAGADEH
jgi:hypothetical protein